MRTSIIVNMLAVSFLHAVAKLTSENITSITVRRISWVTSSLHALCIELRIKKIELAFFVESKLFRVILVHLVWLAAM